MKKNKFSDGCILIIDAGTQSIRASLVDLSGNIVRIIKTPMEPYYSAMPGWAEIDVQYWWKMLCAACNELLKDKKYPKKSITAVTLTTQRATMVNVDKNGNSLRPAISWLDNRKARIELPLYLRTALKIIGMMDRAGEAIKNCDANWIRQNQPDIWERTHKYLLLSGYFIYRLTGEFNESTGNNVGYLPINNRTYQWADENDIKWKLFPIERDKLPALVKPSIQLGQITPRASRETGIPDGLPVIAAATDKGCEILGAGCNAPDTACLSYGTTATVNTATSRYVELVPFMPPYPAAVPDEYYTEFAISRGYWMVSWFKEEFGLREKLIARKKKVSPEKLLDGLISEIPAGSTGLILQPYWSPGVDTDPFARGSIIGFGDMHTRPHLYRAILEGIAYALREGKEFTEKRNRVPVTGLRVSGGGSQSDAAMQITADVFNIPAVRPHTFETSSVGAAMDAAVGLKLYPDFPSAIKGMTRTGRTFEPVPSNVRLYEDLYGRVYLKIYKSLRPLFKDLEKITGYPEK